MPGLERLTPFLSVSPQIEAGDIGVLAAQGYRAIICNRPDGEDGNQPPSDRIRAACALHGLEFVYMPVISGGMNDDDVTAFAAATARLTCPVLAYCRTGTRSTTLWALSEAAHLAPTSILGVAAEAGYDLSALEPRLLALWRRGEPARRDRLADAPTLPANRFDIVIVGGGAAGCAVASSLLSRRPGLNIAIIEPADKHYYQPGWTLVGGGAFKHARTERPMARALPPGVKWLRAACAGFEPEKRRVVLEEAERIGYAVLIVAAGLKLDWAGVEGLTDTLGRNGVTSNYRFDLAPYTWELARGLKQGRALFTQPPMPIKCAGAPQKAMYLSCHAWEKRGVLKDIEVDFNLAGPSLFGVAAYVPTLMSYVQRYGANLSFGSVLKAVDGASRTAWFDVATADGAVTRVSKSFDMLHAVPPQVPHDFIRQSALADGAGWIDVDPVTLRHTRYGSVFGLGDACSTPNAKTAAAARKQAPVVAENVLAVLDGTPLRAVYDGYGSCPLTVERGKVVLAEFGYGGKLMPTFPWDSTRPRRSAWLLKASLLPTLYWDAMLRGREWLVSPTLLPHDPAEPRDSKPRS